MAARLFQYLLDYFNTLWVPVFGYFFGVYWWFFEGASGVFRTARWSGWGEPALRTQDARDD